jgi:Mn2+/Fe2+ NRAMP family transporter
MDISERRIFGALLLLLGVSCLIVGGYTGQFDALVGLLKKAFAP